MHLTRETNIKYIIIKGVRVSQTRWSKSYALPMDEHMAEADDRSSVQEKFNWGGSRFQIPSSRSTDIPHHVVPASQDRCSGF